MGLGQSVASQQYTAVDKFLMSRSSASTALCVAHQHMDQNTQEYDDWYEAHKDLCEVNYVGSSPAVEATGALRIWQRSIDKLKLCYTTVISDGDAKATKHINDHKPYGDEIEVVKHKCVGHVQKVMGHNSILSRSQRRQMKSGRPVKFGGKERLRTRSLTNSSYSMVVPSGTTRTTSRDIVMQLYVHMPTWPTFHLWTTYFYYLMDN